MTCKERIKNIIDTVEMGNSSEPASTEKLVALAYYMGCEETAKQICNEHHEFVMKQRYRASNCRYHKLANKIIGDKNNIYNGNYDGAMTSIFGSDLADI